MHAPYIQYTYIHLFICIDVNQVQWFRNLIHLKITNNFKISRRNEKFNKDFGMIWRFIGN